jgi:hypothetical protein
MSNPKTILKSEYDKERPEIDPSLPPPGSERNEILARRTDELEEAADALNAQSGTIPEKFMQPDHNVQRDIRRGFLDIGSDHPFLKTKWVNCVNQHGSKVWEAKSQGWRVATVEDFPEAQDMRKEDNTLRVADTILMCIRMDAHVRIQQQEDAKREAAQYGLEGSVHDMARRHSNVFRNVYSESTGGLPDNVSQRVSAISTARNLTRGAAQRMAANQIGNRMKEGLIPGIPLK